MPDAYRDAAGYHAGERAFQERFDTRRLADRLAEVNMRDFFTDRDRRFIESRDMFFLATADAAGDLDCSYKGGDPGFVRVVDEHTLAFPGYDGNGTFMSVGNILETGRVGMLFIDWQNPGRMRVNGTATVATNDELLAEFPGAQYIVRVRATQVFANCPRYIHRMERVERSPYVPEAGCEPPEPEWKDHFEEVLPADQQARRSRRRGADPA